MQDGGGQPAVCYSKHMFNWALYPAFIGTFLSIAGWIYLVANHHDRTQPRTLSELAAQEGKLGYFRLVIWVCGVLFALTLFLFIAPKLHYELFSTISAAAVIVCEMLLGTFPASGRTVAAHNILAYAMSIAMGCLSLAYALHLPQPYAGVEAIFTMCIAMLGALAVFDRKRIIFYELPFIFLSHFSMVVAALALR